MIVGAREWNFNTTCRAVRDAATEMAGGGVEKRRRRAAVIRAGRYVCRSAEQLETNGAKTHNQGRRHAEYFWHPQLTQLTETIKNMQAPTCNEKLLKDLKT